jgi:hypothetical protein
VDLAVAVADSPVADSVAVAADAGNKHKLPDKFREFFSISDVQ